MKTDKQTKKQIDVTVLEIKKVNNHANLRATASVMFFGGLIVRDFSVIKLQKSGKLVVCPPCKLGKDGRWRAVISIQNPELIKYTQDEILTAYHELE